VAYKENNMDVFDAIKNRRSCRAFSAQPVPDESIRRILQAGVWAPSPLNAQPWEFVVVTDSDLREKLYASSEACRKWAIEASGWKWLGGYRIEFLKQAPVIVAVVGHPGKSGVDGFQEGGPLAYQHACAAAVQNMLLAAHALELGSLWFTLFDRKEIGALLGVPEEKKVLALVCLGKPSEPPAPAARKELGKKVRYVS
jgi:nitroreductase